MNMIHGIRVLNCGLSNDCGHITSDLMEPMWPQLLSFHGVSNIKKLCYGLDFGRRSLFKTLDSMFMLEISASATVHKSILICQ